MARILIAEDEPDIRELVAFTLRFAGHEVTATANGEEALQQGVRDHSGYHHHGCAYAAHDRL
jgi:CheY-like chemotaxis protein